MNRLSIASIRHVKNIFSEKNFLFCKRMTDIVTALAFLAVSGPFLLFTALLIKLDSSGPALFCQPRCGRDGRVFKIYKFRTMYIDACRNDVGLQATQNDPRITRIGKFLRRTSIDEMPQFLNILKGDMTLVGPRPHILPMDAFYAQHMHYYGYRYRVKPGLTGWAQVHGLRGETPEIDHMRLRVLYDLDYIQKRSLCLDFKIILKTLKVLFCPEI